LESKLHFTFCIFLERTGVMHKKVGPFKCGFRNAELRIQKTIHILKGECIAQRSQEVYWDEFWMMGLFCMGLNTLNN
jgi:hypothetical protein